MPFTPFDNSTPSLPEVPFLNNYPHLKKNNGKIYDVLQVLESEKGLILFTEEFKVFLWNNEKCVKPILETLLSSSLGSTYSQIQVMLDPTIKKLCQVGIEDSVFEWNLEGKVWTRNLPTSQTSLPNLDKVDTLPDSTPPSKKRS